MQEAPFDASRSGSEEDILEYEEPLITCDVCRRKRKCTLGEKILLVVAAVCVIIIIALSVAISNSNKEPKGELMTAMDCYFCNAHKHVCFFFLCFFFIRL